MTSTVNDGGVGGVDDGTITLEEVVPLTRAELEHFTDPKSIEALQRAWDQAGKGEARPFKPTD